jgi:hypothetical protein
MEMGDYRAVELMGENEKDAQLNVRMLIDGCLTKVGKLQQQQGTHKALMATFTTLDLLLQWLRSCTRQPELPPSFKRALDTCFPWLGGPALHPVSTKLLLTCTSTLAATLSPSLSSTLRQTILETLRSTQTHSIDIKQQMLSLLIVLPPGRSEGEVMEVVVRLWVAEENSEYFYN